MHRKSMEVDRADGAVGADRADRAVGADRADGEYKVLVKWSELVRAC
jgi:hypothetical protein